MHPPHPARGLLAFQPAPVFRPRPPAPWTSVSSPRSNSGSLPAVIRIRIHGKSSFDPLATFATPDWGPRLSGGTKGALRGPQMRAYPIFVRQSTSHVFHFENAVRVVHRSSIW